MKPPRLGAEGIGQGRRVAQVVEDAHVVVRLPGRFSALAPRLQRRSCPSHQSHGWVGGSALPRLEGNTRGMKDRGQQRRGEEGRGRRRARVTLALSTAHSSAKQMTIRQQWFYCRSGKSSTFWRAPPPLTNLPFSLRHRSQADRLQSSKHIHPPTNHLRNQRTNQKTNGKNNSPMNEPSS